MKINNLTKQTTISTSANKADTMISRAVGLLKHASLSPGEALIITHCQSIHMLFMKFPIDAIFVNKDDIVVGLVKHIRPFQLSRIFFKASYVIELEVGVIEQTKTGIGDQLEIK